MFHFHYKKRYITATRSSR